MPFHEGLEVMVWGVICSNGNRALCRVNGKDSVAFMKMIKEQIIDNPLFDLDKFIF